MTIVALWIFAKERVDVASIEVGCGGRYDATNILGATIHSSTNSSNSSGSGDHEAASWQVGRLVATGSWSDKLERYRVADRRYRGSTTMDAELAFVMARIGKVSKRIDAMERALDRQQRDSQRSSDS